MPHKGDKKMKLEKFTKNKRIKKIMIGSIVGIVLIIGGITLYRTFAFYEEKKEFNILQGRVTDFKEGDIQLSVFVNEERVEAIPERGNYLVDVSCDKGAIGSWDYNKWSVSVSNFVTKTKCDVKFTSVSESFENICRKVQNGEPCGFLLHLILFLHFIEIYCNLSRYNTAYKMNSQRVN